MKLGGRRAVVYSTGERVERVQDVYATRVHKEISQGYIHPFYSSSVKSIVVVLRIVFRRSPTYSAVWY